MFSFLSQNKFNSVSVNELDQLLETINLIDVREPYEYKEGHITSAKNIPMNNILLQPEKYLDKTKEYHIICQSGGRSSKVCSKLASDGYKVINVSGGTGGYRGTLKK